TKVRADLAKAGVKLPESAGSGGGRGAMPFSGGMPMGFGGGSKFSEKDMAEAKLPLPPEQDSQLDVLLRPGLLADVEIIVEEMKNALHLPMQAIFEKDGKPVVYVKKGNSFEPRFIQPLKRSESTMIISSGVTAGEIVSLSDPTGAKKEKKEKKEKGGGAMGALGQGGAK
ncbi:MAG: efflux RND transporter periplasmic adaptor subunit, partial [Bryobacteraceae bacterium]